jgi:integrase
MQDWRRQKREALLGPLASLPVSRASFAADVQAYLQRVTAMPTYGQRAQHLGCWLEALGRDRTRASITTADVERVMQDWLRAGLAPATVRKRRVSLLAVWHRLDGRTASNPVRESVAPPEPKPEVRGLDYPTITRILQHMPESKTKTRVQIIAWTGLPPGMVKQITPADIDWRAKTLRTRPRRKGAGVAATELPLLPQAVTALRALDRAGAYGPFATPAAARSWHRACRRADVVPIRLYDLRHSYAVLIYRTTGDLATTARLLLHSTTRMTERYARGATGDVDRAALRLVVGHLKGRKRA